VESWFNLYYVTSPSGRPTKSRRYPERGWEVSDRAWRGVERVLDRLDPPLPTGRPRIDPRRTLNGILYRERTGCRWRELPRDYGDDASIHRTFRRWVLLGVFDKIREVIEEVGQLDGAGTQGDDRLIPRRAPTSRPRNGPRSGRR
jgi:transposase